jgi:hypothetical protein
MVRREGTARRGSQVVRQRSAKPLFGGSIPPRASKVLGRSCYAQSRCELPAFVAAGQSVLTVLTVLRDTTTTLNNYNPGYFGDGKNA